MVFLVVRPQYNAADEIEALGVLDATLVFTASGISFDIAADDAEALLVSAELIVISTCKDRAARNIICSTSLASDNLLIIESAGESTVDMNNHRVWLVVT